jgi:hypothetical protein
MKYAAIPLSRRAGGPERTILAGFERFGGALLEPGALLGRGDGAAIEVSPDAVTRTGDEAITQVAEGAGNDPEADGDGRPRGGELAEDYQNSIRPDEDALCRGVDGLGDQDCAGFP